MARSQSPNLLRVIFSSTGKFFSVHFAGYFFSLYPNRMNLFVEAKKFIDFISCSVDIRLGNSGEIFFRTILLCFQSIISLNSSQSFLVIAYLVQRELDNITKLDNPQLKMLNELQVATLSALDVCIFLTAPVKIGPCGSMIEKVVKTLFRSPPNLAHRK